MLTCHVDVVICFLFATRLSFFFPDNSCVSFCVSCFDYSSRNTSFVCRVLINTSFVCRVQKLQKLEIIFRFFLMDICISNNYFRFHKTKMCKLHLEENKYPSKKFSGFTRLRCASFS